MMYFVSEEGVTMTLVVGGTSRLESAKELAEKRAGVPLKWKQVGDKFEAVLNCGSYHITYKIRQGERN